MKKAYKPLVTQAIDSLQKGESSALLLRKARESIQIREKIVALPIFRGVHIEVTPLMGGRLTILVSNPSALTRIRNSIPSILSHLQGLGWNITEISLKIQSKISTQAPERPRTVKLGFGRTATKAWLDLRDNLHDPAILEATDALCKHHKLDQK